MPTNLPAELSSFVGRHHDIDRGDQCRDRAGASSPFDEPTVLSAAAAYERARE